MFFKKKKSMSDTNKENVNPTTENTDNLSQNIDMEEALASVLNTDDSAGAPQPLSEGEDEELMKLQTELGEMKDKYLRLVAEFDNYRRRTAAESIESKKTAGLEVIQSMLVVLDDATRAEKQMESSQDLTVIKDGISLVFKKLRSTLQNKGLTEMELGDKVFNADLHEAIAEIPAPTEEMKGKIIDIVEPGYYLNGKLIRFAKVVVGN